MTGFWRAAYMYMNWEYHSKNDPDPKTLRQRHMLMEQIRLTKKFRLNPVLKEPFFIVDDCTDTEDELSDE